MRKRGSGTINFIPPKLPRLTEEQKDFLFVFDENESFDRIEENRFYKSLQLMLYFIDKINDKDKNYTKNIQRIISKLETSKNKNSKKQLEEFENSYYSKQTHAMLFSSIKRSDDVFTKNPLYDGPEDIDFQISLLERAKQDKDLHPDNYQINTKEDSIYYTLLDNLKEKLGLSRANYKIADVLKITLTHIYAIFKEAQIHEPLELSKKFIKFFTNEFIKKNAFPINNNKRQGLVDLRDLKFDVYRIYDIENIDVYIEVSQIFLDECCESYFDNNGIKRYSCLNDKSEKYIKTNILK